MIQEGRGVKRGDKGEKEVKRGEKGGEMGKER